MCILYKLAVLHKEISKAGSLSCTSCADGSITVATEQTTQ